MPSGSGTTKAQPETAAGVSGTTAGPAAEKGAEAAAAPQGTTAEKRKRRRKELPETRPPGVPQDPWAAFADAAAEKPPGRIRRGVRVVGRWFIHEYSLAIYLSVVFAAALTWPTLRSPMHTLPQDLGDPSRQAWQISWLGHVLQTNPVKLWQTNAYFPTTDSLAYGDSLLGYAPAGLLGSGPEAAVLRYNILFVLAHALLLFGAYALVRQLGARPTGAAVAAAAFAYAPWRLAQEGHLDVVSAGAIPLALALLARGHGWSIRYGFRPDRRNSGWAALGWLVATWQLSLGFALGLPFAYLLGAILVVLLIVVPIRRFRQYRRAKRLKAAQNPADTTEPAKKSPTDTTEPAKKSPADTTESAAKSPTDTAEPAATSPAGTTESVTATPEKSAEKSKEDAAGKPGAEKAAPSKPDDSGSGKAEQEKPKASSEDTTDKSGASVQSKHELGKTEQIQDRSARIEKAEPSKPEENKAEPAKDDPAKAADNKAEPGKTAEPAKDAEDKAEPAKDAADKAEPGKDAAVKAEEPVKDTAGTAQEPVKDTAGKVEEPAKETDDKKAQEKAEPDAKDAQGEAKKGAAGRSVFRRGKRPANKPERRRKPRRATNAVLGWRLLLADYLGVLFFAGVGAVLAIPYLRVPDLSTRLDQIRFFSPPLRSLLIGPAESRIWGAAHATPRESLKWAAEMSLLPGFMLYGLALAGLLFSIWRWRQRLFLVIGLAVAVILTLGTTFFGGRWTYLPLFGHLGASFDQIVPGRLMLSVTLVLAILAAGAVDEFVRRAEHLAAQRTPPRPGPLLRLATLLPLFLVLLEGWSATAHPVTPTQPEAMRTVGGPMLVLPTDALPDQTVQLWTTSRFQQVANGGGNVAVAKQNEMRKQVQSFPDLASISYLRSIGVGTVVLIRSEVAGTPWEQAGDLPVDALGIRREDLTDAVVFRLN